MSLKLKLAELTIDCQISFKKEKTYIYYLTEDDRIFHTFFNGCNQRYHSCIECDQCAVECLDKFKTNSDTR